MPHIAAAAAAAVAAAAPAGVTAAVASTATAAAAKVGVMATMKSIAMKALTNMAISAAMSAFQPQVGVAGRPVEWTLNPDGPTPFAAGRVGVAGSVVHKETFGPDLMYYGLVSVLSGSGPIDGYVSFMGDDEFVTFDAVGKAISSQWRDEMWLKKTLGAQPDTALTTPTGLKQNAVLPRWSSAHKLSGKAAYMLVMGENSKRSAYPMGEVKPIHIIRGLRVWDPRLDSTYPGGSGACRLADPTTWVYSANPYLWALKWSLGLWEGPTFKGAPAHGSETDYQVGGIGAKLSGIDVPTLVAAANIADANGWICAGYPTTDDDKSQVLDSFLQAGGGIYAQRAGKISCIHRAAPRTSIVNITAADTAGPVEIDTAASRIDRINTVRARYWSEAHRWQMQALDDVTAAQYREDDGGTRSRQLDYHYVPVAKQASQLAALQIANTREGIGGVIPLKPHLQRIKPGDCFTITEPGFVLNGQKFLCLNTEFDPATKIVRVTFVSETDGKYPWALGQDVEPPAPPALTPVDPTYVSPPLPGDWTITPRPPSAGGGQVPGFDLGGAVSNDTATAVLVEYGPTADGPWKQAYQGPPTVQNIPLDGLQPGQTYYVGVRYQRNQNYSDRYVYGPYVAPPLVAGDVLPTSPVIQAMNEALEGVELALDAPTTGLKARTDALHTAVFTATTGLKDRSDVMYADINTATSGLKDRTNALWSDINTASTGVKARLGVVETNLTSLTSSTASRLTSLEATVNTAGTGLVAKVGALETATSSLQANKADASALNSVAAEVSGARNGKANLAAELSSMRSATSDGLAQKASAAEVALIQSSVTALNKDRMASALGGSPAVTPENFTNGLTGSPSTVGALASGWTAEANAEEGTVYRLANVARHVSPQGWLPIGIGRTHRVTARVRVASDGPNANRTGVGFRMTNDAGLNGTGIISYTTHANADGWLTLTFERTSDQLRAVSGASTHFRVNAFLGVIASGTTASGATAELSWIRYDDVTDAAALTAKIGNVSGTVADALTGKAEASRTAALEATVNTAGTGLVAKVGALETATSNLQANKADASAHNSVAAEISGARNGKANLAAELSSMRSATSDGLALKASAADLALLQSSVAVRNRTFRQSSQPANPIGGYALVAGDRWINTASGQNNRESAWTGAEWVDVTDPRIATSDAGVANLSAKIGNVSGTVADALAGKADASRAAALEATVNTAGTGLVAKVGALETATSSLQTNKADASALNSVAAEVSGARNGKPTLAAELSSMRSATSDGLAQKASASEVALIQSSVTALNKDRMASALGGAPAVTPENFTNGLTGPPATVGALASGWTAESNAQEGIVYRLANSARHVSPQGWLPIGTGRTHRVTARVRVATDGASPNRTGVGFRMTNDAGLNGSGIIAYTTHAASDGWVTLTLDRTSDQLRAAGGASTHFRIDAFIGVIASGTTASGATAELSWIRYDDITDAVWLSAKIGNVSGTVADAIAGKADASRATALEASINTPGTGVVARLAMTESVSAEANGRAKAAVSLTKDVNGYISGHGSTNDGTTAAFWVLADVFGLIDPDGTHGTEFRDGCWYVTDAAESTRTRYGRAFGGTQKLMWWTGLASTPEGSETKANAYVYISMNTVGGPRFGGSDTPSGGGSGTGGAALASEVVAGSIASGGFQTLAIATFANRPSIGWWSANVGALSGSSDGFSDNTLEFRIIEQGATVPYASGTAIVPAGMLSLIDLAFDSSGPWPQTQSAGAVTLLLQARRTGGSGMATIANGRFTATYTPGV